MAAYTERGVLTTAYLMSLAFDPSAATCICRFKRIKASEIVLNDYGHSVEFNAVVGQSADRDLIVDRLLWRMVEYLCGEKSL